MIKIGKHDKRPFCIAYTHPSMGVTKCCLKNADWVLGNLPAWKLKMGIKVFPVCRDHIAKTLINLGDAADDITFDVIFVDKD